MSQGAADQARKDHATLAARAALLGLTCRPDEHGHVVLAQGGTAVPFPNVLLAGEYLSSLEAINGAH
jgi:hypothetical protein